MLCDLLLSFLVSLLSESCLSKFFQWENLLREQITLELSQTTYGKYISLLYTWIQNVGYVHIIGELHINNTLWKLSMLGGKKKKIKWKSSCLNKTSIVHNIVFPLWKHNLASSLLGPSILSFRYSYREAK